MNKKEGFRKLKKQQTVRSGGDQVTINREGLISIGKKVMTKLVDGGVKEGSHVEIESDDSYIICVIFDSEDTDNPKLRITNGSGKISCKGLLMDSGLEDMGTLLSSEKGTPSITDGKPEVLCDKDGKMIYIDTMVIPF